MIMQRRIIVSLIIVLFLVGACKREPISWDNRVAAPLFTTQFRLGNIKGEFLEPNANDSSYRLVY